MARPMNRVPHPLPLLCADQRKEVVLILSDSSCGTLEVTGR
jgi:hypothetical protein